MTKVDNGCSCCKNGKMVYFFDIWCRRQSSIYELIKLAYSKLPSTCQQCNLALLFSAFLTYESGEMHWPFLQMVQIFEKVPALLKSSAIYEYKCHCDSRYIGRTSQRLEDPIKQHVPKRLIQRHFNSQRLQADRKCKKKQTTPECDSAIDQPLLESSQCAANYQDHQFSCMRHAVGSSQFARS